jgi:hypothetical protein
MLETLFYQTERQIPEVSVTVALFERVHHHGIYHARRSVVRQYIIDKLKAEGEKAYITKEDPKVIMARIVQRCIAVCSLKRCVPIQSATESLIMDILQTYLSPPGYNCSSALRSQDSRWNDAVAHEDLRIYDSLPVMRIAHP